MSARAEARQAIEYFLDHDEGGTYLTFVDLWPEVGADDFVDSIADDVEEIVEQSPARNPKTRFGRRRRWFRQFVEQDLPDLWLCSLMLDSTYATIPGSVLVSTRCDLPRQVSKLARHQVE